MTGEAVLLVSTMSFSAFVLSHDNVPIAWREHLAGNKPNWPALNVAVIDQELGAVGNIGETTQESFAVAGLEIWLMYDRISDMKNQLTSLHQ